MSGSFLVQVFLKLAFLIMLVLMNAKTRSPRRSALAR
jgi:hypothetical protein